MNVSRHADHQFVEELRRTDRPRYDQLIRAMQKEAYRLQRIGQPTETRRTCEHCGLLLPADQRADTWHSSATMTRLYTGELSAEEVAAACSKTFGKQSEILENEAGCVSA